MLNRKNWLLISLVLIGIGTAGALNILINGEEVMGINNDVPWGILIAGYVFFAVASTGVGLISSLGHVFGMQWFEAISKRALLASLILLLCGFGVLLFDLGNPLRMLNFLLSPNLSAPIWWMGALYGLYLILLLLELNYSLKNDHHKVKPIAKVAFFVKLAAVSNLGAVFAMLYARPYWSGAFYPVYMIVTAILSGAALLSIIYYFIDNKKAEGTQSLVKILGKILTAFLAVTLLMELWQVLIALYGSTPGKYSALMALINGPLSIRFWLMQIVIGLVIPLILLLGNNYNSRKVFNAAVLTMVGILSMRLNFVTVGQIIPLWSGENLIYNSYIPSWSEWTVIIGAIGASIFLYLIGEQKFDLTISESGNDSKVMASKAQLNS
ncbi:MAG: hypothetical protein VR72_18170 [Clostridiaceae bacterium BRH_c20a]|nr:MAG: hypothetical protein VR72_18170 [Clostridiaceae bacterium BRH_c20a]